MKEAIAVYLDYGTGTAPANQAALTGTQKGAAAQVDYFPTASKNFPFGVDTVISRLTLNTAYWFDLALAGSHRRHRDANQP